MEEKKERKLRITEDALKKMRSMEKQGHHFRVVMQTETSALPRYHLIQTDEIDQADQKLEDHGVPLYIEQSVLPYIETLEIGIQEDYNEDEDIFTISETIIWWASSRKEVNKMEEKAKIRITATALERMRSMQRNGKAFQIEMLNDTWSGPEFRLVQTDAVPDHAIALEDQGMTVHIDQSLLPYIQTLEIGVLPDYGDGDPVFSVEETIIWWTKKEQETCSSRN